ncbi:hypothetical protein KJZ71_05160 [Patescibacteria group bacterium]|jgi:plastocyanin|uniref:EfeO-type cupredoxin-like domain-containing protein n=1 Tax=candidate division WWE3 bacterium TaxID=2053526 RepID=A0A928Y4T2_UNCKA|nr:hypothetical protein [candidate division WWE3 bacterium]MCL4733157.1 hypothetical protein [Patescibacteria group bacterium]MDL1953377.1 hypothetical protein [Candidatus Uhrbacteria bacterium UHB]RIL00745.1 MAG: hypothetical protein DCC77_04385 [Candidatus Uhrbacteria bacterium]
MMKRLLTFIAGIAVFATSVLPTSAATTDVALSPGDLITSNQTQAVYYYAPDGRRYVFPNEKTYFTWYPDFSTVKVIDHGRLSTLPLGRSNVTYRPGVKMVKITTDPRTYVVERGGILRHVTSEELAKTLYGTNWKDKIEDVPDAFFSNYKVGTQIDTASQYSPADVTNTTATITQDKSFDDTIATISIGNISNGFVPKSLTIKKNTRVTWVNRDIADHTVTGTGFNSGNIPADGEFSYTFKNVGSYNYSCSIHPSMTATINVVE